MKRREFITAAAMLFISPRLLQAQGTPRRIGFLSLWTDQQGGEAWLNGLRDHGWIAGKNLTVDYRFFEAHAERLPACR